MTQKILIVFVFFLLVLAGVFWYANTRFSNAQIAATGYEKGKMTFLLKPPEQLEKLSRIERAEQLLESKQWQKVIDLTAQMHSYSSHYAEAQLLAGCAHYNLGQNDQAIAAFSMVANSNDQQRERATLLLAITYLKKGDVEKALIELQKIESNTEPPFVEIGQFLMQQLNSFWRVLVFI